VQCEHATRAELSAYVDGELSPSDRQWWDRHLAQCPACRTALAGLQGLRASLRTHLPPREPSSAFRDEVRQLIRTQPVSRDRRLARWRGWEVGLAATLLFGLGLGLGHVAGVSRVDSMAAQVVAGHVRSLEVDHLVDVASSEHHVVKPWFAGKLDFSPPVPDLASAGYPLLGARVDYLGGRTVAALVYQRGPHRINLLIWPESRSSECRRDPPSVLQGFNLLHGNAGGMEFWAVSDLNRSELDAFVVDWQREAAGATCR
jgi:anti-sigma factor RsiW